MPAAAYAPASHETRIRTVPPLRGGYFRAVAALVSRPLACPRFSNRKRVSPPRKRRCLVGFFESAGAGSSFDEHFRLFYEDNAASVCSRPAGQVPRGKEKGRLWRYETRNAAIDEEISMCGYFVIATSYETSASEAIRVYKNRDALEKVFLADKSFLGFDALRVHSDEAMGAKTLIEFVALILRCSMYSALKRENETFESPRNYFTVPMARDILEMINVHRVGGSYPGSLPRATARADGLLPLAFPGHVKTRPGQAGTGYYYTI